MNKQPRKTFAIILGVIFVIMNILFVIWPLFLILEDIRSGTMHGTNIEMLVLLPYLFELLSIPVIICEILIIIFSIKDKKINVFNLIAFGLYISQVVLFNVLLFM